MCGLTLKREIYELLKTRAKQAGMGINAYLERILLSGTIPGQSQDSPAWQNVPPQTEPILNCFPKNQQFSWSPGRDLNPRPAAYEAAALTAKPPGPNF